jgi:hypothetical protein
MIVFGGGSPRSMLVYGLVSIAILAFSYFVIIKPITDSTNDTVNNALNDANQQFNQAFGHNGGTNNGGGSSSSSSSSSDSASGSNSTPQAVYNACIQAGGSAARSACDGARTAFQQCESSAASASICQDAANQTIDALKAAG